MKGIKDLIKIFDIRSYNYSIKRLFAYFVCKVAPYILTVIAFYPGFWAVYTVLSGSNFLDGDQSFFKFIAFLEIIVLGFATLFLVLAGVVKIYNWAESVIED